MRTSIETTINDPDGNPAANPVPERVPQLMINDFTSYELLAGELRRIRSGRCMLCARHEGFPVCDRCLPEEDESCE